MAHGRATYTIAGFKRTLDVPIELSIAIEDATGESVFALLDQGARIKFKHACIVLQKHLEWHEIAASDEQIFGWARDGGMAEIVVASARILSAFVERPEKVKGSAKPGKSKEATATPAEASQ